MVSLLGYLPDRTLLPPPLPCSCFFETTVSMLRVSSTAVRFDLQDWAERGLCQYCIGLANVAVVYEMYVTFTCQNERCPARHLTRP